MKRLLPYLLALMLFAGCNHRSSITEQPVEKPKVEKPEFWCYFSGPVLIFVDAKTGVNYIRTTSGPCPVIVRVNADGTPYVTK